MPGMGNRFDPGNTLGRGYDETSTRSDSMSRCGVPKRGKKPIHLQSGIYAKATDVVKCPQDWPHIALQGGKVGAAYSFLELDSFCQWGTQADI